ncbi:MAG: hypothetical protein CFE28_00320 [Alphaproteobacteria bacterium PA2]|nr:MAG: hypothetical protein CFE28_00320 [Alphaproteobacteria bacterium PA2]
MRITINGSSGSGKSTLARRLSAALDLPHVELDAVNWQPGWVDLNNHDRPEFHRRVLAALSGDRWVTDGNYSSIQPQIRASATDAVWLDYPRPLVMGRVIRRSFVRAMEGKELWPGTGNVETFARWLDKEHPIRWSWDNFNRNRRRYGEVFSDPANAHLRVHHLKHPREVPALVARLKVLVGV